MIRLTKRSLAWTLSAILFISVVTQMWYSLLNIVTSTYTDTTSPSTLPSSSMSPPPSSATSTPITATTTSKDTTTPPSRPARYERDYTTLIGYPISLLIVYCFYFLLAHCRHLFPDVTKPTTSTTSTSPSLPSNISIGCDQQDEVPKQPSTISNSIRRHSSIYLLWRRWWHYEIRFFDNTYHFGTYLTLLALAGQHAIFIVWPFSTAHDPRINDPLLQHQLVSNRIAQLALVDMAVVVALSVRTSIFWRKIGLYNSSMTLPWHRWFARFSILGVVYHGCFQWTKHYYRHQLAKQQNHQLDALLLDDHELHHHQFSDLQQASVYLSSVTWWDLLVSNHHYLSGTCMVMCLLVLFLGSHPLVREKCYRLFRMTHVVSFLGLVGMGMWHHWAFVVFYVAVVCVWLVDVIARLRSSRVVPIAALDVVADQVVKLQLVLEQPAPSSCRCRRNRPNQKSALLPGQYAFCSFSGSKWKDVLWSHPFSISRIDSLEKHSAESGEAHMLTFYIKVYGKQTRALYESASIKERWPTVRIGAPQGHPSTCCHWTDIYGLYPVVVLVAEGIGITPWMAVLHSLVMMENDSNTRHVNLIWTIRDGNMVKPFIDDIEHILAATKTNGLHLNWHIFVTGTKGSCLDEEQQATASSSNELQQRQCHYQYHQGRPNYVTLLESIRLKHDDKDVALGICAHADSVKVCGNLARSAKFSHANAFWNVRCERFEL